MTASRQPAAGIRSAKVTARAFKARIHHVTHSCLSGASGELGTGTGTGNGDHI